jgi:hypothetical protein
MKDAYLIVASTVCIVLMTVSVAIAQRIDEPLAAYWLQFACSQDANQSATGYCQGAIEAPYSVMEGWCVPKDVTPAEVKRIVVDELLSASFSPLEPAAEFIWGVIDSTWPCR